MLLNHWVGVTYVHLIPTSHFLTLHLLYKVFYIQYEWKYKRED